MRKNPSQKIWPVYQKCLPFYLTHIHGTLNVLRSTFGLLGTYQFKAKNVVDWHHDICTKINVRVFYAQKKNPMQLQLQWCILSWFLCWLTIAVIIINNLSTAGLLLKQQRKLIAIVFFDLFPSACIKRQERTVSITIHQHWVCLNLHEQE